MVMLAAAAAAAPSESPKSKGASPKLPMLFYLAKGEADACGDGCSEWIAAEGGVDSGAGQRLRTFLNRLGKRKLPIYFHSPGGNGAAALDIGRQLRAREMTAAVYKTMPTGCVGASEEACRALKQSGQVLPSTLHNMGAGCNSACVFALIGAKVRHVPPGARLGVHAARLEIVRSDGRKVDYSDKRTISYQRTRLAEVNAQHRRYVQEMKIDVRLFDLAVSVPHESIHYLSRDEIVKFGVDTREFQETRWGAVELAPPDLWMMKYFVDPAGPGRLNASFLRISCGNLPRRVGITYFRYSPSEEEVSAARSIKLVADERSVAFSRFGTLAKMESVEAGGSYSLWSGFEGFDFLDAVAALDKIEIVDQRDSEAASRVTKLSTGGMTQAIAALRERCNATQQCWTYNPNAGGSRPVACNPATKVSQ